MSPTYRGLVLEIAQIKKKKKSMSKKSRIIMIDVQHYYRITYSSLRFYLFHRSYTNFPPFLQSLKNIFKINPKF